MNAGRRMCKRAGQRRRGASLLLRACTLLLTGVTVCGVHAQDRREKVLRDLEYFLGQERWIYNDVSRALEIAAQQKKPVLAILRCIPCEHCSEFDQHLLEKQAELSDLLDQFVCLRIVHVNGLDLSLFQFDYDQSFHALALNADRMIYGRFGSRSARKEQEDMTLAGFRAWLTGALDVHRGYPDNRAELAGKQPRPVDVLHPEDLPGLKGKYTSTIDYEGKVVQSCIHCHQIRDEERRTARASGQSLSGRVLYPYPLPDVLGMVLSADEPGRVAVVENDSIAAAAGVKPGDRLLNFDGHRLLSTADLQWALHQTPEAANTPAALIERNDQVDSLKFTLPDNWRAACDISWRPTTWELRADGAGGIYFVPLSNQERADLEIPEGRLALRAKHVGKYDRHAVAHRAGFQDGDILIAVDGKSEALTETQLLAYCLQKAVGSAVQARIRRGNETLELSWTTQ